MARLSKKKFSLKIPCCWTSDKCVNIITCKQRVLRIFFYDDNGEEYTSWIAFENYFFTEQFSYTNSLPSRYAITAIEETEVLKIHKQQMDKTTPK